MYWNEVQDVDTDVSQAIVAMRVVMSTHYVGLTILPDVSEMLHQAVHESTLYSLTDVDFVTD